MLLIGLVWSAYTLAHTTRTAAEFGLSSWSDGSAGRLLDSRLRLPWQSEIDTNLAGLRYRVWGDLGPQVSQGCEGWLFYKEGLRPAAGTDAETAFAQRIRLMRAWTTQLRAERIAVLVVPVPDKSRIQGAQLCGLAYSEAMRVRLDTFESALRASGVPYVDLRGPLFNVQTAFFRTDVHLNAMGASAAAGAIVPQALGPLGARGAEVFKAGKAAHATPRVGDLLVLAGLAEARTGWRPAADVENEETLEIQRTGGLLDDTPTAEVMLAGSSNGRRSLLAERLGQGMGREVWNVSLDGGQYAGALMRAMAQRRDWPSSVKLVIWEFSEMSLSLPLTDAEQRAIALLD